MASGRVLVVGFDGLDGRYLERFSGALDGFGALRDRGVEAPLSSVHPPWTGAAWPAMYAGLDPSHTGAYDFFDYRDAYPDDAPVLTRDAVRAPALWNYATAAGRRSVVLNVPVTHPAESIDGVVVPGYLAPADAAGHPPGIREELASALETPYEIYSAHETGGESSEKIDGYETLIERRGAAASYLLETYPWELAFVQVQKTDAVFHNSDATADFERIYRAADDLLARLLDVVPPDTNVIVCSDHGIGPVTGYTVYVNELLRQHGFVETASGTTDRDLGEVKRDGTSQDGASPALERLGAVARRLGFSPARAYRMTQRLGIGDAVLEHVPDAMKQSLTMGVDWRRSRAYCRSGPEQGIRINLAGRDPAGAVPRDRYDAVRDRIVELLRSLETPEGDPVFEYVRKREEVYDGPFTGDACDILFRTTDMNHFVSTKLPGGAMTPANTHNHKATGVFLAAGPDVNEAWGEHGISLLDVAPIAISLLDEPVPDRLQGTVPDGLLATGVSREDYGDVPYGTDGTTEQDQAEVTDRLRDLGYI